MNDQRKKLERVRRAQRVARETAEEVISAANDLDLKGANTLDHLGIAVIRGRLLEAAKALLGALGGWESATDPMDGSAPLSSEQLELLELEAAP